MSNVSRTRPIQHQPNTQEHGFSLVLELNPFHEHEVNTNKRALRLLHFPAWDCFRILHIVVPA